MLFKRIESEGLAHYSYIFGHNGKAAVIDPRLDCGIYLEMAVGNGYRINHIFETHRNEDYLSGSAELARRSGAEVWHADSQLDYDYGTSVKDGDVWKIGGLTLTALHTPGHTEGSMSYLLRDPDGNPWIVFTGDLIFAGDVGRTDFLGKENLERMAGLQYDSIYEKILPLGDGVIMCAAHGAGSVCGGDIAQRTYTTVGMEREYNPHLQYDDRNSFIKNTAKIMEYAPYFKAMEKENLEGRIMGGRMPIPMPLSAKEVHRMSQNCYVLDTRDYNAFASAHVPGAISIWAEGVPSFTGWFIPTEKPIILVNDSDNPKPIVRKLIRIGFHNLAGYLSGGMLKWHMAGLKSASVETVSVQELCGILDAGVETWILDVRSEKEQHRGRRIPNAHNIPVTHIIENMDNIPEDKTVFIFCGSGLRAMTAASLMKREERNNVVVILGGMSGWSSVTCELE